MGVYKLSEAGSLVDPRVNYTSMLAGNDTFFSSAYELISSTILGSTASDVTFSSLGDYSSTYKHLQIRWTIRGGKSATDVPISIQFNGITSASYRYHALYGNGSSVYGFAGGSADTGIYLGNLATGATSTSGNFGAGVIDILDPYSTSKNTTVRGLLGTVPVNTIFLGSGVLLNTASITSIRIFPDSGGYVAGSRFSIYGLKG